MQTTTKKTKLPSSLVRAQTKIRTPLRRGKDDTHNATVQRNLRKIKDLWLAEQQVQKLISERKRMMDLMATYMVETGIDRINLLGTDFNLIKKERANWTHSLDIKRQEADLKVLKQEEKDTGVATNDPTIYTSVLIEK